MKEDKQTISVSGMIIDLIHKRIFPGTVTIVNQTISNIREDEKPLSSQYILPGFIDAHVHIESSMMTPSEFARLAVVHGTIATISDPHEIGNVLGIDGVRYMIENGKQVPFHFFFGASPCVPATAFETAGACINTQEIQELLSKDGLTYLSEMMNFPGVLSKNQDVLEKIKIAHTFGKPVDGHAPGLRGEKARAYISAGISTDHECFTLDEALDKINYGMKILIREGSAAKNFEALHSLIKSHPEKTMFCSDDKHPDELVTGHINTLVKRAIIEKGYDLIDVLRIACLNPIKHYQLGIGLLQKGDSADFIVVNNLEELKVIQTYIKGKLVSLNGQTLIPSIKAKIVNHFIPNFREIKDFAIHPQGKKIRVIEAIEGELITNELIEPALIVKNNILSDISRDNLKMSVVCRYAKTIPALAFIRNFGLKRGAIASSVAHDSHNVIAIGTTDEEICRAVNTIMEQKGGLAVIDGETIHSFPLPLAGIMSAIDGYEIAKKYAEIDMKAKMLGTKLKAPFMTLSFMALLVIPSLKLSDKGLFNGNTFNLIDLQIP